MNVEHSAERLSDLSKAIRVNLGELRKAGADETRCDTIDVQSNELAKIGGRALEELQMLSDSMKASA